MENGYPSHSTGNRNVLLCASPFLWYIYYDTVDISC